MTLFWNDISKLPFISTFIEQDMYDWFQERAKESEEAAANARRYAPEETECTIRTNASPDAATARGKQAGAAASAHSGRATVNNLELL